MALGEINSSYKKPKSGGGILGKIAGTLAGGAIGFFAGGPAGAATGANLGSMIGGTAGEAVKPGDAGQSVAVVPQVKAKPLNAMMDMPEVQLATLQNAREQLPSSKLSMDEQDKYRAILDQASERLKRGLV